MENEDNDPTPRELRDGDPLLCDLSVGRPFEADPVRDESPAITVPLTLPAPCPLPISAVFLSDNRSSE